MRIDEFSSPSYIDGTISDSEMVRIACFGFDIESSEPIIEDRNIMSGMFVIGVVIGGSFF